MFDYSIFAQELENLKEQGLYTYIRTLESPQGAWLVINGKKVLNLCSNNYLGFANEERLKNAAIKAIEKWGVGPGAVRTIAGTFSLHEELEKTLAEFKKVEATIFLQSGFVANQAVIPAITNEKDAILSDELNHASIIDGVRLSKAMRFVWKHRDVKDLEKKLKEANEQGARRKLIITDGVFSMDGDLAPLPEIVELAEKYDAMVMVDDAHGEGVLGSHGRGIVDHFGLHGRVDIEIGTLSKAFGVLGGYIAGKKELIEYLKQKARPFLFSSPLSPADTAAALEATKILQESDERVNRLWENAKYFKNEMRKLGFDTGESETPITPVMLYDAKLSTQFSKELFNEGIFAQSIGYPTVPKGKARIRVMISATHSKEDLDFALEKFEKVGKKLNVI
ncbi:glycine C-acetyltransferase [Thermosipho atlanticus]|uniref:8-amino-7-ketopelargonate synthase n=1 Tax=Thermosipho atlanticus DSM 15807 TaxID=1123380 RepID=A0A1M5QXG7_9BACT|nr:glycine C-acetyltransferase [Thermosipho atlanticus]SHH18608.1 2-amino-3-ketobutyrate coenzyme A ligase [Thermosipho atlanticus DSM 15807]